jgi:CheY-like chemotaxis protein/two-component sensor histidine kinase
MNIPSILVVDDEPDNFDVIETLLSNQDYQLHYAANGQEALNILEMINPDLILLDVMMPNMDGIEVCQKIKTDIQWKAIPVIMVTALTAKEDLARCLEAGADDFVSKPINRIELLARIKSMLRIKQQYDTIQHFSVIQRNTINILGQNLEELTSNLATNLPHELNTPLTGIMSIITLLQCNLENMNSVEIQDLLSLANQSAHRLESLTNKFLIYLELELQTTQQKPMEIARTRVSSSIFERKIKLYADDFNRSSDLVFEIEEANVCLSERYLFIIFQELVDNALKFSQQGTKILVKTEVRDKTLEISLQDQGRGMTTEQVAKIGAFMQFEKKVFAQPGTGIGLKIVKKIVELAGGKFSITSVYQQETLVKISLPIAIMPT